MSNWLASVRRATDELLLSEPLYRLQTKLRWIVAPIASQRHQPVCFRRSLAKNIKKPKDGEEKIVKLFNVKVARSQSRKAHDEQWTSIAQQRALRFTLSVDYASALVENIRTMLGMFRGSITVVDNFFASQFRVMSQPSKPFFVARSSSQNTHKRHQSPTHSHLDKLERRKKKGLTQVGAWFT